MTENFRKKGVTFDDRKRIRNLKVLGLCQKVCPIDFDVLTSHIEFETGLSKEKAVGVLRVLFDIGKIEIDGNIVKIAGGKDANPVNKD